MQTSVAVILCDSITCSSAICNWHSGLEWVRSEQPDAHDTYIQRDILREFAEELSLDYVD